MAGSHHLDLMRSASESLDDSRKPFAGTRRPRNNGHAWREYPGQLVAHFDRIAFDDGSARPSILIRESAFARGPYAPVDTSPNRPIIRTTAQIRIIEHSHLIASSDTDSPNLPVIEKSLPLC